jgi:fructan beta-fructosidase
MVVAGGKLRFFSSENLLDWRFESCDSTIDTECPDLFELPIEAENGASSWVLSLGGRAYMLGEFDGSRFTPTTGPISMSGGPDFYASQSFSNEPAGRRIILSWLFDWSYGCKLEPSSIRNVFPTGGQAGGCLTVPYELSLARTGVGPRLRMRPAREVDSLRTNGAASGALRLNAGERRELPGDVRIGEVSFVIRECPSGRVGLRLKAPGGSYSLGYDRSRQSLFVDRRESGLGFVENYLRDYEASPLAHPLPMRLRILLDRSSVELFAEDGASHMSAFVLPDPSCSSLEIYADSESLLEDLFVSRLEL